MRPASTAAEDAKEVASLHEISRGFRTNILAVLTLLGEAKIVVDRKDNTIFINDTFKNPDGVPKHFREIGPVLFHDVDGQDKLAFVKDAKGRWGFVAASYTGLCNSCRRGHVGRQAAMDMVPIMERVAGLRVCGIFLVCVPLAHVRF
jgi:hypothetical protein